MDAVELLVDDIDGRLHAAVTKKGILTDLYVDSLDATASWASIYMGKVIKIDTKLDAALIDLGNGLTGFLPAKHIHYRGADASEMRTGITELLKGGQMLLVQVKSEAKKTTEHEQQKMPRLTMKIYLSGLFLNYSPYSSQVTISRKIANEETHALTTKLTGKGGWLVQPHAEQASEADLNHEAEYLQSAWKKLHDEKDALDDTPRLLRAGPNALLRALVDYGATNFEHIHTGNKKILDMTTSWCEKHIPALAKSKRLRLFKAEKTAQTLFETHDLYAELEALKESQVTLQGGGSLVIEISTALTMIDVNQGSGASIAAVNQAAALELARQVRLRNLSGVILADFINLEHKAERLLLLEIIIQSFANDYADAQVHGFTRLGIVEITRKRRDGSLSEKMKN
jgi:ribonuclease E/ribonuclease G